MNGQKELLSMVVWDQTIPTNCPAPLLLLPLLQQTTIHMQSTVLQNVRGSFQRWTRRAAKVMEERPVLTNSVICFNLWVFGDLLAQSYEHPDQSFHYTRTLQAASYGAVVTGPIYALWYPFLERTCVAWQIARRWPTTWAEPLFKVAADEFIMDPPTISMFFAYMEFCQNDMVFDWERTKQKIVRELPVAWATSLVAWPAVLLATFRWVPIYAQPAVVNACAIVWDGFLSHRNAMAKRATRGDAAEGTCTTKTSTRRRASLVEPKEDRTEIAQ